MTKPIVFLVDDCVGDHLLLELALGDAGLAVDLIYANDGKVALESLAAMPMSVPGLVILIDLNLGPVSGLDVLKTLRCRPGGAGVPIIIWSASSSARDRRSALEAGATAFLGKAEDFAGMQVLIAALVPFLFPTTSDTPAPVAA